MYLGSTIQLALGRWPGRLALLLALIALLAAVGRPQTFAQDHRSSVAREWDEELLAAIRLDVPAPTVHARNLFHLSIVMYDAWAAYDETALGYLVREKIPTAGMSEAEIAAARREAISYAAYRLLTERFEGTIAAETTLPSIDARMAALGYDKDNTRTQGTSPAALGNRIAATLIAVGLEDGSNEAGRYRDPGGYEPVNEALFVGDERGPCPTTLTCRRPGGRISDPNRWQPLAFDLLVLQNGIVRGEATQEFIGPHWGSVTPFALMPEPGQEPWEVMDPGPPPLLGGEGDAAYREAVLRVLRLSSKLDPQSGEMIDLSPAVAGNRPLGTHEDHGYERNPVTGEPYEPFVVPLGDYGRVVAEFWADGPASETPPGHWNVIANEVSESPDLEKRVGGTGPVLDDLAWDVRLYLALNGAVHDAAVAAWGAKGFYDYIRPISMVRYMGKLGQSTDPDGPSYHPDGLPLEPGLVEVITEESSAPGERHEALAEFVGDIAVHTWARANESVPSGVRWIRAADWLTYQLSTFVTPSFAGYVSGHSTFSRAAAEVMTAFTGDPFFPGGLGTYTAPADAFLEFETGPSVDIVLQWATYRDAADEAGISRLYGGIHVPADDFQGRIMGAVIGQAAYELAIRYFAGDPSLAESAPFGPLPTIAATAADDDDNTSAWIWAIVAGVSSMGAVVALRLALAFRER